MSVKLCPACFLKDPSVACRMEGRMMGGVIKRQVQQDPRVSSNKPRESCKVGHRKKVKGTQSWHPALLFANEFPGHWQRNHPSVTWKCYLPALLFTPAFINLPPKNKANRTIIESRRFSPYVVIIFLFSNSNQPSVKKNRLRERLRE